MTRHCSGRGCGSGKMSLAVLNSLGGRAMYTTPDGDDFANADAVEAFSGLGAAGSGSVGIRLSLWGTRSGSVSLAGRGGGLAFGGMRSRSIGVVSGGSRLSFRTTRSGPISLASGGSGLIGAGSDCMKTTTSNVNAPAASIVADTVPITGQSIISLRDRAGGPFYLKSFMARARDFFVRLCIFEKTCVFKFAYAIRQSVVRPESPVHQANELDTSCLPRSRSKPCEAAPHSCDPQSEIGRAS